MFQLKLYRLPHDGVIPGAHGHKKQVIPRGTKVYCIVYHQLVYWCAYLNEEQAFKAMRELEATATPGAARRYIPLESLVAWNFKIGIPKRVCRP